MYIKTVNYVVFGGEFMKKYVKDCIDSLNEEYNFPNTYKQTMYEICDKFSCDEIEKILSNYKSTEEYDYPKMTALAKELSEKYNVHLFCVYLFILTILVPRLKDFYKRTGVSDKIAYDTILGIYYKYKWTYGIFKVDGVRGWGWAKLIFSGKTYRLGRFEYEISEFLFDEYQKDGNVIKKGEPVLNIHIPDTKEPITKEIRQESYNLAKEFFRERFNNKPIPFVCFSWMTCPYNEQLMSPTSNVLDFMRDFEIIKVEDFEDFNEVSPFVFNSVHVEIDTMPQETSLQRNIKKYLLEGKKLGRGYGVFFK